MSTLFQRRWQTGIRRLIETETEQAALGALVDLCADLAEAPAAGVLHGRAGLYESASGGFAPAVTAELAAEAARRLSGAYTPASARAAPPPIIIPLGAPPEQLGLVCIGGATPAARRHAAEFDTLARLFVQTIENLRWRSEAQVLGDLSAAMASVREPTQLLQHILTRTTSAFCAATSRIFLLDERSGDLVMMLGASVDMHAINTLRLPLAGTIAGQVVQREQGLIYNGERTDELAVTQHETGVAGGHALGVPLRFSGRVFGALLLVNPASGPRFAENDLRFLTTAASTVAALIANTRLYVRAVRDALTGAYNRGAFNSALEQIWARAAGGGGGFALILIDLDNFKHINDRFGHSIGDQVLQSVTQILWETLRSDDGIFRYGGEEFCVLLPDVSDAPVALAIAERLRAGLDCSLLINGLVRVPISASLGVALHPAHGARSPVQLLDMADDAAYQAKRDGKNRVVLASLPQVQAAG